MASAVGLFQPVPPSPYVTPLMVMGSKNVGAAEVARAASQIRAEKASSMSVLYVRMRWAAAPAPRVRMAMTKTKVLFVIVSWFCGIGDLGKAVLRWTVVA